MSATNPSEQTLGNREGVPSWLDFLGPMIDQATVLPPELLLGSFRGGVEYDNGDRFVFSDFSVVFRECKLAGKGVDKLGQFIVTGLYSRVESGEVRLVMTKYYHNPARRLPIEDRHEMRCVLSDHTASSSGVDMGAGFSGDVFAMDGDVFRKGKVALWPTPPQARVGGFLDFTFHTPICGLEHTGAVAHWTGLGAEVKRTQGPSHELGMRPGDVVKAINGEPVAPGLRSRDVSMCIKLATRPMVMVVWREVGQTDRHSSSNLDDIREDSATHSQSPSQMLDSFNSITNASQLLRNDMLSAIERKRQSLDRIRQRRKPVRSNSVIES